MFLVFTFMVLDDDHCRCSSNSQQSYFSNLLQRRGYGITTTANGRRIALALKGGFPMVDGGQNTGAASSPGGRASRISPGVCDHIALYALFSITVSRGGALG